MPNTLVHFGVQGVLNRAVTRRINLKWVFIGCVLPDVPWILWRILVYMTAGTVDPLDLRLYAMTQASLICTLPLCAAIAFWTRRPAPVFTVLAVNSLLHLLIDACEIKWGNGVHLLAPFSWKSTSFGLFWHESAIITVLTILGILIASRELIRRGMPSIGFTRTAFRALTSLAFLIFYAAAPIVFVQAVEESGSYSVDLLRRPEKRPGSSIALERSHYRNRADGDFIRLWTGEVVRATGLKLGHDAVVSVRGRFLTPDAIRIEALHEHRGVSRDVPTYIALFLLLALWTRPLVIKRDYA